MADAKKKSGGKGLGKRAGPLPIWGWAAVAAGSFVAYRFIKARNSANAVLASTGTTGGTTIPADLSSVGSAISTGAGSFSSMAAWEQAAITYLTGNGLAPTDALNAISAYTSGSCVDQSAYNALAGAISSSSVGLPPGFTSPAPLTVCPGSTAPTTPQVGQQSGSGFLPAGVTTADIATNPGTLTATDAAGNVYTWLNPDQYATWKGPVFAQTTPGNFNPYTPVANELTPVYALTGGPAYTAAQAKAAALSGG